MSSRELLELLDGLPEASKFKEASERTFRVAEYRGERTDLKGKLLQMPAVGPAPKDVVVVAEYVDWTYDRKLAARNVRELVALRNDGRGSQVDFAGLLEPLDMVLLERQRKAEAEIQARGQQHILAGLYGYERR
ncbi:hypothetical protein KXD96_28020 (plasmid) [Mycobacterium sp. SMC-2]|nr:hypothetical protein [Mycobacterium sp. SMC-2]UXA09613.1 hypothetical protein KXD96_27885 [Mycobacterium sp. SMC-2]UXA09678.1 hypothetical protein KXD96_28020 [Mycobacterium sp. SMC-2]